MTDSALW